MLAAMVTVPGPVSLKSPPVESLVTVMPKIAAALAATLTVVPLTPVVWEISSTSLEASGVKSTVPPSITILLA